ncbi:hypothetical protein CKO45_26965, partial [Paracraurococcus ruber]|nr:hypothetical protein [Paracraurococcus ruber]
MLAVAGGLLGAVAVAGAVTWGLSRMGPRTVPVIEAASGPVKVKPAEGKEGGLIVPNQDQLVLQPPEVRREAERRSNQARLGQGPEQPQLDLLRQQAAPPAPPSAISPAATHAPAAPAPSELAQAPT